MIDVNKFRPSPQRDSCAGPGDSCAGLVHPPEKGAAAENPQAVVGDAAARFMSVPKRGRGQKIGQMPEHAGSGPARRGFPGVSYGFIRQKIWLDQYF